MYIEALSPAQLVKRRLAEAEELARVQAWKEYEEAEAKHKKERFKVKDFSKVVHGKPSSYSNGCRCEQCRASWREYMRERNKKYREEHPRPKREPKGREGRTVKEHMHGTLTGYAYGCRCEQCTEAHRIAKPKAGVNHGKQSAYRKGCRCRTCVKAQAERVKPYRKAHYERKKMTEQEEQPQIKKFKPIPAPKETHEIVRTVSAYELQDRDDAE